MYIYAIGKPSSFFLPMVFSQFEVFSFLSLLWFVV
jgi:hypothetical protein